MDKRIEHGKFNGSRDYMVAHGVQAFQRKLFFGKSLYQGRKSKLELYSGLWALGP